MNHSGIKHFNLESYRNLKKEFLYFDKLHFDAWSFEKLINNYSIFYKLTSRDERYLARISAEVDFLVNKNVLSKISFVDISNELMEAFNNPSKEKITEKLTQEEKVFFMEAYGFLKIIKERLDEILVIQKESVSDLELVINLQNEYLALLDLESELWIRINSKFLPTIREYNEDFTPIINRVSSFTKSDENRNSEVLAIILNKFPVPDDSVSWEQLIDFKSEEESRIKLLALKSWVTKIGHTKYSKAEIEQEFEYLTFEYENQMKLQKLKYNIGTLELLVNTGMDVLGNLVSFQWGKASKAFFDIKRRHVDLLIGETKAPGKELAYINKIKKEIRTGI